LFGFTMLSGQACCAGTRVFVQQDFHDEFVDQLTKFASSTKVGNPLDPKTTVGPLVSKEQFDRVKGYLALGKEEGAKARVGGEAGTGKGYFVDPTVFTGVKNEMRIAREEIFGPVASVIPFKDKNDAVLQGNDTTYGLAAAVWTNDVSRAHKVARALKAGAVWVNSTTTSTRARLSAATSSQALAANWVSTRSNFIRRSSRST
jgi:acyl-CoA reductase-like NAD-dependent aldehyde dehydrogenase